MALLSRVLAKMAARPPQRVRPAMVVVGVTACTLLVLALLVALTGSAEHERDRILDFDLLNRGQTDAMGPPGFPARKELLISIGVVTEASGARGPQYRVGQ